MQGMWDRSGWEGGTRLGWTWQGTATISGTQAGHPKGWEWPVLLGQVSRDHVSSQPLPLCLGVLGCSHPSAFLEPCRVSRKQVHSERPWAWWARQLEVSLPNHQGHTSSDSPS